MQNTNISNQKDAFTDVADLLQQSQSENTGNNGNNSTTSQPTSTPSPTVVGQSGETINLGIGSFFKQK